MRFITKYLSIVISAAITILIGIFLNFLTLPRFTNFLVSAFVSSFANFLDSDRENSFRSYATLLAWTNALIFIWDALTRLLILHYYDPIKPIDNEFFILPIYIDNGIVPFDSP